MGEGEVEVEKPRKMCPDYAGEANWKASVRPAETARRERDPPVRGVQQCREGLEG